MAAEPVPPPVTGASPVRQLWQRVARHYLHSVAIGCVLTAGAVALGVPGAVRGPLLLLWSVVVLLALVAARLPDRHVAAGAVGIGVLGTLGLAATAVMLGWGDMSPLLGFMALHAAFATAIAGPVGGGVVGASAMLSLVASHLGWGTAVLPPPGAPLGWVAPAVQVAVIGVGLACGAIAAWGMGRFANAAEERQRRFQGLLQIAADAYWELDPHYRLQALSAQRGGVAPPPDASAVGNVPWEHPAFVCQPDVLDQLQADLDARQRFRDVPVQWQLPGGARHLLVSGEPRFSARSVFQGYWGVVRDVTDDERARQALAQTRTRYQDLFTSIPTPLVLHRDGRVIDANPAALAMFGYRDAAAMGGSDLLALYEPGDSRERAAERMALLQTMPAGESLDVTEFQLVLRSGRRLSVRGTGVAVATERGQAVLSIYVDDTERQAAEDAVRRSEALLSHLVASSPDVITLTDFQTGRYAMVNRSFEQLTGWTADEVVGRTSMEIGIWADLADRERLVAAVRAQGRFQDLPVAFRRRDDSTAPMLVSGARFAMGGREYLVLNARDVTEIERSRLEREAILDNASLGIALTRDQKFQMVNPAFEAMLGWPDGSIIGQPGCVVWPSEAEYVAVGQRISPALLRGEQVEIECTVRRRDGSSFLCRMLARAVDPSHPSRGGTIWVVEDITERRRLDEALARARDAAEAASRAKSAFLANTSHELRTPLNGLLGLAQLARAPGVDDARRGQYLDQIVDSAQALAMVVSDILDLSKIEAGRLTVESQPFDLGALLQSLRQGYAPLAAARGLSLALDAAPTIGLVQGDALRVRQILTNFLGNAIKFTSSGGVRLVVHPPRSDGTQAIVRFEVHDTGPGIDEATLPRLFQPFTQADESTTRRFGGTGLGLSICRELAALMGGQVGVRSVHGQGSCFWAELPLPSTQPAQVPGGDQAVAQAAIDQAAMNARTVGAHVLMVDDNEINMMVAVAQLQQFGVRVGQAADGRQALDAVAAADAAGDPFDLVMMDLQMPVLSGYEVTRELRRQHPPEALPIVAYTAAALVTERQAALAAGMNDFLPKPCHADQLRAMVARWVKG